MKKCSQWTISSNSPASVFKGNAQFVQITSLDFDFCAGVLKYKKKVGCFFSHVRVLIRVFVCVCVREREGGGEMLVFLERLELQ